MVGLTPPSSTPFQVPTATPARAAALRNEMCSWSRRARTRVPKSACSRRRTEGDSRFDSICVHCFACPRHPWERSSHRPHLTHRTPSSSNQRIGWRQRQVCGDSGCDSSGRGAWKPHDSPGAVRRVHRPPSGSGAPQATVNFGAVTACRSCSRRPGTESSAPSSTAPHGLVPDWCPRPISVTA